MIRLRSDKPEHATASGTTFVVNKPAGTVSGDLLVAAWWGRPNSLTFTMPSGFTQKSGDGTNPFFTACNAIKTAGGSEPSTYTFTASGSFTEGELLLFAYYDDGGGTPVYDADSASGNGSNSTSIGLTPPSTAAAWGAIIAVVVQAQGTPLSSPAGWRASFVNPNSAARGVWMGYMIQPASGSPGTQTWSSNSSASWEWSFINIKGATAPVNDFRIRGEAHAEGTSGSASLSNPGSAGDLAIAVVGGKASDTIATPTGWTAIGSGDSTQFPGKAFYRKIQGGDTSWSFTTSGSDIVVDAVAFYEQTGKSLSVLGSAYGNVSASGVVTGPSIIPTSADSALFYGYLGTLSNDVLVDLVHEISIAKHLFTGQPGSGTLARTFAGAFQWAESTSSVAGAETSQPAGGSGAFEMAAVEIGVAGGGGGGSSGIGLLNVN